MDNFETQKNAKAGTITGLVCGALIFLSFVISWAPPQPAPPPVEEGIEVNLGNSDFGSGDIQPMIPGEPSDALEELNSPPQSRVPDVEEAREPETNDNDKEAPDVTIPKPAKPTPATNLPKKENANPTPRPRPNPVPVDNPEPKPRQPKVLYKGGDGSGKGGNNADSWNNSSNQGIAGGKGDQGKPGGNPNSDSYTGNAGGGRSGVSISRGLSGRRISRFPSFEDEFNENAKVAVDVRVDRNGNVVQATYQARGSTTSDMGMRNIALNKARQLKFNPNADGPETDIGTIIFNFRLKN